MVRQEHPGAASAEPGAKQETFEQFFALSLDMLCVAGTDGYFRRLNPAFAALGYTQEELLSRPFLDFVHPDDVASTLAEIEKLSQGAPTVSFENRYRCKDGSYRWLVWTSAPNPSGTLYAIAHDITARKRIEETSRQTNQFLEAILENLPHMVFVKEAERLSFVRLNRAGEDLLGISRNELLGKNDYDLFPRGEAEFFVAKDRQTLASSRTLDIPEEPIQTKGGPRLLHTKKVPIADEAGTPRYLLGISEDITLRKAGEEALARLGAIIEGSEDAIISRTLDGVITSWNRGAEKIFGYPAAEAVGQPSAVLFPLPPGDPEGAILERLRRDERVDHFETVRRRKDGREIAVSLRLSPLKSTSGQIIGISQIARDISERKAAEAALARKNQELEVAARLDRIGARVMIALSKQDESTRPAAEVLRVLAEEAGYRPLALYLHDEWQGGLVLGAGLSLAPGYDRRKVRLGEGLVGEAAAQRQPVFIDGSAGAPFSLDTGVGVLAPATLFAIPLIHQDKLLGVVAGAAQVALLERERSWLTQVAGQIAIGLHAIRQLQELKDLSQQLNERSRKIEAQNRELAHASRLKSEFLASMSHELRTPLNAIIGFSEVLKDGLLGDVQPRQAEYATHVYESGRHLLSLINDILDLSKIEAGKMELDVEPVDVPSLIANALTIMKERAIKGGVTVTQTIAPGIVSLDADGRKLRQIVYNLLSNAVKFTPSGGSVRVEVTRVGEQVELAITDSGIGISPEGQARLFRPFEQLDGGISRRFEGTGLGLVMVKNLVELHGGTIGLDSAVGKGSRFWVRLPATQAEAQAPRPAPALLAPPRKAAPGEAPRVLVVDDDTAAVKLTRRWLENEGYEVEGAGTCDAAWTQIQQRPPDAILLDILFQDGPSGWEFLERLRDDPDHADIPVVVVSIAPDLGRGLALGALQVLQKPVAGVDLLQAVGVLGLIPNKGGPAPRVLVVDDDPRSVEHVTRRLERAGISVTRAYGGQEALAALAHDDFSAMVLDLMMPEVSGFEVVRALRAEEATADFPIIILTAKMLEPGERATLERSVHKVLTKDGWEQGKFLQVVREALRAAPARADRRARARPPQEVPRTGPRPQSVLVIDDDATARELLRLYLEDAGFAVTPAASAEEAFARLDDLRPDLITLDLAMPVMDGCAFLAAFGQSDRVRGIPVLVVSSAQNPQETLALGAHAVLPKPIRRRELLEVVERLLGGGASARPYILVVDDDPRAIEVVTSYFADEPFEVGAAGSGREALERLSARCPDLLILDLMMPDVSGFDVLTQLRDRPETADLPVVVLTAKDLSATERGALARSVQAVFGKATARRRDLVDEARRLLATPGDPAAQRAVR